MSEPAAQPANEPATNQAPMQQQPQFDAKAIAQEAARAATEAATVMAEKKATEIAAARIKEIGRALTGEQPVSPQRQVLENLVDDPLKTFMTVKEVTKREIREELRAERDRTDTQRSVVMPILQEYPELNKPNRLALVERLTDENVANGMSYPDALKKGCEDTVKEFNLKSVTEAQRDGTYRQVGLPGGGGVNPGAPQHDEQKSQSSFLDSMRNRMVSFRKRSTS